MPSWPRLHVHVASFSLSLAMATRPRRRGRIDRGHRGASDTWNYTYVGSSPNLAVFFRFLACSHFSFSIGARSSSLLSSALFAPVALAEFSREE